ncbi:MAG: minor capsid protein [Planctomycetota bacterium]
MTSFDLLPPDREQSIRKLLRERLDEWLRLSFRHDILVARAVEGLRIETAALFDREVVRPLLLAVSSALPSIQPRTGNVVQDLFPEVARLRAEIERIAGAGVAVMRSSTERLMEDLARREIRWMASTTQAVTGQAIGTEKVLALLNATPDKLRQSVWLGDSTEKWFQKALERPTADAARAWVTTGIKQSLTTDEIVRGLVGTRTQTGVLDRPRATAKALVRTAATHATTTGRQDSFQAIGVGYWRFTATLDLRTTLVCSAHDGEIHRVGEGPLPPLHVNCRSVAAPVMSPDEEPIGKRAALGGRVPATTTVEDWWRQQSAADQDLVMGKTRAAAWRAGKLSLKDMLGRDLQPLTLDELRRLDRL